MSELQKSRYEMKYLITESQADAIRRLVQTRLIPDAHSHGNSMGYRVRSLYLDSRDLTCYNETQCGTKESFQAPDSLLRRTSELARVSGNQAPCHRCDLQASSNGFSPFCRTVTSRSKPLADHVVAKHSPMNAKLCVSSAYFAIALVPSEEFSSTTIAKPTNRLPAINIASLSTARCSAAVTNQDMD